VTVTVFSAFTPANFAVTFALPAVEPVSLPVLSMVAL